MSEKFCVDCKHHRNYLVVQLCMSLDYSKRDLVTGKLVSEVYPCRDMRAEFGYCGSEGALFEPKESP